MKQANENKVRTVNSENSLQISRHFVVLVYRQKKAPNAFPTFFAVTLIIPGSH